jgi:hypothetical protein
MIDLATEKLITLRQAAALVPPARRGRRCHTSTIFRWITRGAKAPDGAAIRLEAIRRPGAWLTSGNALERFFARLTPMMEAESPRPPRSPAARQKSNERARKRLEDIGI